MKSSLVIVMLVIALGALINVVTMAKIPESSTVSNTYMGVDANDKEAVKRRQEELNHEKWVELFGNDVKVEDFDFSNFDASTTGKLGEAVKNLFNMVLGNKPELTSTKPEN